MPTNSPLMNMPVPNIGPTGDTGPAWATYLNQCLSILDSHTHVSGQGALVPTGGLNINADLQFNANNVIGVRSYRCNSQSGTLVGINDKGCVYNLNGDMYWNNNSGTPIQITSGSAILTPLIVSGTWSPSAFTKVNITTVTYADSYYMRVNNVITFHNTVTFTVPGAGAFSFTIDLPFIKLSGTYTSSSFIFVSSNTSLATIAPNSGVSTYLISGTAGSGTTITMNHSATYSIA